MTTSNSKPEIVPRKEVVEEVKKELQPLLQEFYPSSPSFRLLRKYAYDIQEDSEKASLFLETWQEAMQMVEKASPKIRTLMIAMYYLCAVEAVAQNLVNQTILLLIAQGHDLHLEPDRHHRYTRHATSLEDLRSPYLPLSVKLDFLRCNGISFFSKCVDTELRNEIAHLKFQIDDNGEFYMYGKKKKTAYITEKARILAEYIIVFIDHFSDEIRKSVKPSKQAPKA